MYLVLSRDDKKRVSAAPQGMKYEKVRQKVLNERSGNHVREKPKGIRRKSEQKQRKQVLGTVHNSVCVHITTFFHSRLRSSPQATHTAHGSLHHRQEGLRILALVAAYLKKARSQAKARCRAAGSIASVGGGQMPRPRHTAPLIDFKRENIRVAKDEQQETNSLCVIVHDNRHAVHAQSIRLRHHALPEAVGNVVRAQKRGEDARNVHGDDGEGDDVPAFEHRLLELEVVVLAARQDAARIAGLAGSGLNEGREVAAAVELVLDAQTTGEPEHARPLRVDLALQVERAALVREVARGGDHGEHDPEQNVVDGEEATVVEEDAGPAEEGGDDAD